MIITGSTSMKYFGIQKTEPKDVDILYTEDMLPDVSTDSHKIPKDIYDAIPQLDGYITPTGLLTLKMSHLQWDIKWFKTLDDILWLKEKHGVIYDKALYHKLVEYWKTVHGDKFFLNLEQTKEDFFTDKVSYPMDHDKLHRDIVAPNVPTYMKCLKGGADVAIDKNKFDMLSFLEQVKMFKEEITVIAIERWLLNKHNAIDNIPEAYLQALKKTITNLTKGWASDFIIFNIGWFIHPDLEMFYNVINNEENEMIEDFKEYLAAAATHFETDAEEILLEIAQGDTYPDVDVKSVYQDGGGEGGSENCTSVFEWRGHYFKVFYSYYSYDGYWTDGMLASMREVRPAEKVVTVYE